MKKRHFIPPLLIAIGLILIVVGFRVAAEQGWLVDKLIAAWIELITETIKLPFFAIGFLMIVVGIVWGLVILLAPRPVKGQSDKPLDLFQE